ncbi:LytTR family DNA-binding domain-containing protein [Cytophagaceae bacterium ABcell3]|nr:LytTR family DNA-binding domain-containing protein [Cytophagaceae bacterium ABcell3]
MKQAIAISPEIKPATTFSQKRIVVMDKHECVFLNVEDIMFAEADGGYTRLHLNNGKCLLVSRNLKALSERLSPETFLRIHKSFIININTISKYIKSEGGYVVLTNGKHIPVSVRKKELLLDLIEQLVL